jgi:hypothetical protein
VPGPLSARQTIDAGRSDLDLPVTATVILTPSMFGAITSHSDRPGPRRMSAQWQAFSRCPHVNGCRSDQLRYFPPLDVVQVRPNGHTDSRKISTGGPNSAISPGSCLILAATPWGDTSPCSKKQSNLDKETLWRPSTGLGRTAQIRSVCNPHCDAWDSRP